MKKKEFVIAELVSYIIACILGVIFHFVYSWSNQCFLIGLFFPVNESIWEHLKLVFFPIIIVSLAEYYLFIRPQIAKHPSKSQPDIICIKLKSALIGMSFIVILFYTIHGILGKTPDYVNIIIYFISMAIAYLYSCTHIKNGSNACNTGILQAAGLFDSSKKCLICFFMITIIFMIFTVCPPNLPLFFPNAINP